MANSIKTISHLFILIASKRIILLCFKNYLSLYQLVKGLS